MDASTIACLRSEITELYDKLVVLLKEDGFYSPDLLLFAGPGDLDGHAAMIEGASIAFLDLSVIQKYYDIESFERETHLLHECQVCANAGSMAWLM